ncbi:DEAD-box ATP-dependent RNA helicase 38 [Tanacetum coccineum]
MAEEVELKSSPYSYFVQREFKDYGLSLEIMKGLKLANFIYPSRIQAMTLSSVMHPPYKSFIGQGTSGSGKTASYVICMLRRVDPDLNGVQGICILESIELCFQVLKVFETLGKYTKIRAEVLGNLKRDETPHVINSQVLIGTPHSIYKWMRREMIDTSDIKVLVFDETYAIFMDEYDKDWSEWILKKIHKSSIRCQVLMMSTSLTDSQKEYLCNLLQPKEIFKLFLAEKELFPGGVQQFSIQVSLEPTKAEFITEKLLGISDNVRQAIIFGNNDNSFGGYHGLDHQLQRHHGEKVARMSVHSVTDEEITKFINGKAKILQATDKFPSGLHLPEVNMIINFHVPATGDSPPLPNFEVYLQRAARCGKFGKKDV